MIITQATTADLDKLVPLINSAYRGEASRKGWTTEADLLDGELRTDIPTLSELMQQEGAMVLKHVEDDGRITGCVFLQVRSSRLYLGMLSVSPELQDSGIGKRLMHAAEAVAHGSKCTSIFMNVISLRLELIAWYERRGYKLTGETRPLPDDQRFGIPLQPLEFAIMEKKIG